MSNQTDEQMEEKVLYVPDRIYSITITPADQNQKFGKSNRIGFLKNFINSMHDGWSEHRCHYLYFPEYSEPRKVGYNHKGPRAHVHGVIYLEDCKAVKWFLEQGLYRISRGSDVKIGHITDHDIWYRYITKQTTWMRERPLSNSEYLKTEYPDIDIPKEKPEQK